MVAMCLIATIEIGRRQGRYSQTVPTNLCTGVLVLCAYLLGSAWACLITFSEHLQQGCDYPWQHGTLHCTIPHHVAMPLFPSLGKRSGGYEMMR